jgi:2-isopropylmalate synthase
MTRLPVALVDYSLRAVTGGQDAMGNVVVRLKYGESIYMGRGVSTDVIEASIRAYLHALNRIHGAVQQPQGIVGQPETGMLADEKK